MSIRVGGDIGLEMHPHLDQFIRVESGHGFVKMGDRENNLTYRQNINGDYAVVVPAGTWHNIVNIGNTPLKLYSIADHQGRFFSHPLSPSTKKWNIIKIPDEYLLS